MFKRSKVAVAATIVASGFGLAAGLAQAQTAETQRIEITGSSIKRVAAEGAVPIQTFSAKEIEVSGATSVTDFMQSLPVMQGFTAIADSVGGGGGGLTTASIHDVGSAYTLVLLNGRRVAPATSGTTIDLNSIPLAAVERIEVLTDGASALYGADAIAGVVNFILKKGASPFKINLRASVPQHGGAEEYNFSVSKGFGNIDKDGFSLHVAAGYDVNKQLKSTDREFSKTGILVGSDGGQNYDFFNGSSRSVPPNVVVRGTRDNGNPYTITQFNPYLKLNGKCAPVHVQIGSRCFFDYTTTVEIYPEVERMGVYASGELKLGGSGLKLFGDLAYTDVATTARIAPYPSEFSLAQSHPYYSTYILPYLTPAQAAAAAAGGRPVSVVYRLYDMGSRTYEYSAKATHAVGGIDGNVLGFDINAAATLSKQNQATNYKAGFPLADKFQAGIDAQAFDPFPYTAGQMPASQLAALRSTQYIGNYNKVDIEMTGLDAKASRDLFKMGGGSAVLAFGADMRTTSYHQYPNAAVANAEILFDDPQPSFNLERDSWGAYAEMLLPIAKSLEATVSVRRDTISGTTDKVTGITHGNDESATTYKLAGKWNATSDILVRASYGTGFRTGSMLQYAQPKVDFGVTGGTYNCPFSASYDPLGFIAAGYLCDNNAQYEAFSGGNPQLKPETSKQWNLGVVFQATKALSVSATYWSVEIEDAVSNVSEQLILENASKYLDLYTSKYKASTGLTSVAILFAPTNIGKVINEGVDWDFTYRGAASSMGRFTGKLAGTYLIKSAYTIPGTDNEWTDSMSHFGVNDAVSFRNVIAASGTLETGSWTHTLAMNYRSGYTDQKYSEDDCIFVTAAGDCTPGALQIRPHMTFDWQTKWDMSKMIGLTVGVKNVFDKEPPLSLRVNGAGHQLGYDPRYASPLGRTFYVEGALRF